MKIHNREVRYFNKQKVVTGRLLTSKNWELLNSRNNGLSPLDNSYNHTKTHIILPAGTWVDYYMQETHIANYHTISYTTNNLIYTKTVKIKD